MSSGHATQMLDLATAHMRDLQRDARERAARAAVRRGRTARRRTPAGR